MSQYGPPGPPQYGPSGYYYPPPPPPRRSNTALILLVVVMVLAIVGASFGVIYAIRKTDESSSGTATRPNVTESAPETTEPVETELAVKPSDPPGPRRLGDIIRLHGIEDDLLMAVKVTKVINATPANQYIQPKQGYQYVAVELIIKNIGKATYSDAPSNSGLLIDADDQQHRSTYGEVLEGAALNGLVKVSPGDTRKGVLVFEIPRRTKLTTFQFTLNSGFAKEQGEWSIRS
ncbi:DUF4352 domain-containing protein [Acrocarpospora catenulata]|uniref:DUF4352 domain-containing protein n=1 Tax=Acrocarpospora catenulata TaxID=2836182 RepID=UPI001BD93F2F|nr:DUF4352 domain-containing protein [Acrocarpospora catenulata]